MITTQKPPDQSSNPPQQQVKSNMANTRRAAKQYLSDVNDSAYYPARALVELVTEAFALTEPEAKAIYREWVNEAD